MNQDRLRLIADFGISLDTETWAITDGNNAPPIVCGSVGWYDADAEKIDGAILDRSETVEAFVEAATDDNVVITGANIAMFDLVVLAMAAARKGQDLFPLIFQLLDNDRVYDLQIAEALNAIAHGHLNRDPRTNGPIRNPETGKMGRYSLAACVDMVLGRVDAKANDEYRLRYHELDGIPIDQWPETARVYPVDDAKNTHEVALAQIGQIPKFVTSHRWALGGKCSDCGTRDYKTTCRALRAHSNLHDVAAQVRCAFAMALGAAWGFKVDQKSVDTIEDHATRAYEANVAPFIQAGLIRADGSEDRSCLKRKIAIAYGARDTCEVCNGTGKVLNEKGKAKVICYALGPNGAKLKTCDGTGLVLGEDVPRSEKEGISYGRDTLHESGDEFLMSLGDLKDDQKIGSTYIPSLRKAREPLGKHLPDCTGKKRKKCACPGPYRDIPLTLRPNPVLETGRVSYSGTILLMPRWTGFYEDGPEGDEENDEGRRWIPSLRECVVARPGHSLSSSDYEAGELIAHGQSCIWIVGASSLAEALVSGVKIHNALGAEMIGLSYDEFMSRVKEKFCVDARQAAKPGNFGFPGGMGAVTLVLQQRKQGPDTPCERGPSVIELEDGTKVRGYKGLRFCILMNGAERCGIRKVTAWGERKIAPTCVDCIECAQKIKQSWSVRWPENSRYFAYVTSCLNRGQVVTSDMLDRWPGWAEFFHVGQQLEPGQIIQHGSGRIRFSSRFNAIANGFFQALLGDFAKAAYYHATRECYDRTYRVPDMLFSNSIRSAYAGGPSPLYGSHLPVFQHDEIIGEHPDSMAHDGAMRIGEIMVDYMRAWCPDLAPAAKVEPCLMKRWLKSAKAVHDSRGRLIPWEPKQ